MKKSIILIGTVAAIAIVAAWQLRTRSASSATLESPTPVSAPGKALGIEALMKNVDSHRRRIAVEGVVSALSPTNQMLGLIDVREFQTCGLEQCAEFTLPVRWTGTMPTLGRTVRAEGEVQETRGKFVFVAQTLEERGPVKAESKQ